MDAAGRQLPGRCASCQLRCASMLPAVYATPDTPIALRQIRHTLAAAADFAEAPLIF